MRRIHDRVAPGAVVLLYHRVADLDFDPQLLAVSPSRFAEHLDILEQRATPVALSSLHQTIHERGGGRGLVAITFDDGYADNLHTAKPLLEQRRIPATVFVSSGYCRSGREFWWDELERILLRPSEGHRNWNVLQKHEPTPHHRRYRALFHQLFHATVRRREEMLEALRAEASSPADARPSHRPLTADEVRALRSELVDVGAHTVSHPRLSALQGDAQREEIDGSRRDLEQWTGAPVKTFAYPFGGRADYDATSVALAQSSFDLACSNFPATVRGNTPRFEIPRIIVRNWSAREFTARLGRLLGRQR